MSYTKELEKYLLIAEEIATGNSNKEITSDHLLLALLNEGDNYFYDVFLENGGTNFLDDTIGELNKRIYSVWPSSSKPKQNLELIKLIDKAETIAGENETGLKELFEAMKTSENEYIRDDVFSKIKKEVPFKNTSIKKFCVDMLDECQKGNIKPIIGREKELKAIVEILSKRYKNNPFLTGEQGVGKKAIVNGLAYLMYTKNPLVNNLGNRKIYKLNKNLLTSTDAYKGELASNVESLVTGLKNEKAILYIDDVQYFKNEDFKSILEMMKGLLTSTETSLICTSKTGLFELDKSFLNDFQKIEIKEMSKDDTLTLLRTIKKDNENYHSVKILDESLVDIVNLSSKYIRREYFPHKAIDLLDSVCSYVRLNAPLSMPELDKTQKEIKNTEAEIKSLKEDKTTKSDNKVKELQESLKALRAKENELYKEYKKRKEIKDAIKVRDDKIKELNNNAERLMINGESTKAAKIINSEIPALEKEIEKLENNPYGILNTPIVKSIDVYNKISEKTNIPVYKLGESDVEKYLNIEENLKKRVTGQDEALKVISDSLINSVAGMSVGNKPRGSFLFVGPSGVGKTECAKALAEFIFGNEKKIVRIDMSEFQQEHMVQRLIGAPAGYVGYEEGGQLTDAIKKDPYSVILVDEVEKGHPKVLDLFLQIMDDGILTDARGEAVDFSNAIIIMTSNIGGRILQEKGSTPESKALVSKEVKSTLRPELLNRYDKVVFFNTLDLKDIRFIVNRYLNKMKEYVKKGGYNLEIDPLVVENVVKNSQDSTMGARIIDNYIKDKILTPVSRKMLEIKEDNLDKEIKLTVDKKGNYVIETINKKVKNVPSQGGR